MFILIFGGICLAGYYYILARLFSFFKLKQNVWFWGLLVFLAFGYIGFSMLERRVPLVLWEWGLKVSALALGVGWLCLVVLLFHDVLYGVFRFPVSVSRWIVVGLVGGLSLYAFVNTFLIEVKTIVLAAPVDMRIVQLSDIHRGSVSEHHLRRLVYKTNALNPDLVLITGDLLDPAGRLSADSIALLHDVTSPVYWSTGNHERYAGLGTVMELLATTPVRPLRNEATLFGDIQLIGIDDNESRTQVADVLGRLTVDPQRYTILLYHRPDGMAAAAAAGVDLMLTGHTHNGQIWPFNWVVRSRFPSIRGMYQFGDMALWVSTGSGTWGPPMRLGSRNQITFIHLKKR